MGSPPITGFTAFFFLRFSFAVDFSSSTFQSASIGWRRLEHSARLEKIDAPLTCKSDRCCRRFFSFSSFRSRFHNFIRTPHSSWGGKMALKRKSLRCQLENWKASEVHKWIGAMRAGGGEGLGGESFIENWIHAMVSFSKLCGKMPDTYNKYTTAYIEYSIPDGW